MGNYLKQVREQYENYPYPPRDPQAEKTDFQYVHQCQLDVINHYHFGGRRDFSQGLRVLVAGGGTGSAAIMMAEQLRDTPSEIVYIDISTASLEVAKARAKVRGLDNIQWIHGSLLDAARLTGGGFDYIDCCGVLHHLEKPEDGLAALAGVLKDDGVLSIMLYARYGREMIYRLQSLMRMLNEGEEDMQQRVENCKRVLKDLPPNFMSREERARFDFEISQCGDNGIYDMFLHSHDVAYRIPELYRFTASASLDVSHLFFNRDARGNFLYQPDIYTQDAELRTLFAGLSVPNRQASAEILHGRIMKHTFYAVKSGFRPPVLSFDDLSLVPYFNMCLGDEEGTYRQLVEICKHTNVGDQITITNSGWKMEFAQSPNAKAFFTYFDGKRSTGEILKAVQAESRLGEKELWAEFHEIYQSFNRLDWMLLKAQGLPSHRSVTRIMMDTRALYAAPAEVESL